MIGRRLFNFGALGAGIATSAPKAAAANTVKLGERGSAISGALGMHARTISTGGTNIQPLIAKFNALFKPEEDRHARRGIERILSGGYDPDIASLVSVSMSTKARMQAERVMHENREYSTLRSRIVEEIGLPDYW